MRAIVAGQLREELRADRAVARRAARLRAVLEASWAGCRCRVGARAARRFPFDADAARSGHRATGRCDELFAPIRELARFDRAGAGPARRPPGTAARPVADASTPTTCCDRVRQRFLENVRIASLPHAQLTAEQKEFKTRYNRGRRELEHEFGKTMRLPLDSRSGRRRDRAW